MFSWFFFLTILIFYLPGKQVKYQNHEKKPEKPLIFQAKMNLENMKCTVEVYRKRICTSITVLKSKALAFAITCVCNSYYR